jgi:formylglycine-generating enzyme required for sulfatase activity
MLITLAAAAGVARAVPVITNIAATQRAGTKLVDIAYDLSAPGVSEVSVTLQISSDGGATFAVPAASVTGAIGAGVSPGSGRVITWNAGLDWNQQVSSQVRFRITADDGLPGPVGYSLVPAGAFTMGDSLDGLAIAPPHSVTVEAFYIQQTETTKAQWDEVKAWAAANGYTFDNPGLGKAPNHPVQNINWYDMVKWCNALSEKEGLVPCYYTDAGQTLTYKTGRVDLTDGMVKWTANGYRLPTEAEWEKASRGGVEGQRFPWGAQSTHAWANYYSVPGYPYDPSPTSGYHPGYQTGGLPYTSPVGSFPANGYGVFDMCGNVFEWCWDWLGPYPTTPGPDTRGPATGTARVLRGTAWDHGASWGRCAFRNNTIGPEHHDYIIGFRPVRRAP